VSTSGTRVDAKPTRNAAFTNANNLTALPDPLAFVRLPNLVPNLLATRGSVAEMQPLTQSMSLADAKLAAAQSDDPVLWVNSIHMGSECLNSKFLSDDQAKMV
jgi:hypothetical protein